VIITHKNLPDKRCFTGAKFAVFQSVLKNSAKLVTKSDIY